MKKIEIAMQGLGIERLRISGKKDWAIFWTFTVMAVYVIGGRLDRGWNDWLRSIGNPWLTDLNEPQSYGRMIAAVLLLAVVMEVMAFLCRKSTKVKVAVPVAGLLLALALVGAYQVHSRLIVSVLWEEEPAAMTIWRKGESSAFQVEEDQAKRELQELCRGLVPITDQERLEACREWCSEKGGRGAEASVHLSFLQKYGHSYVLWLDVKDGYVYLWRGYDRNRALITFFEDNGIVEYIGSLSE